MDPVSRDEAVQAAVVAVAAGGGAVWLAHWGWPWTVDINDPDFNPLIGFLALLAGLSLWHAVKAARAFLRHRAFGGLTLDLDPPGHLRLGGALSGRVRTERPVAATGPFRLVLTCHDVHQFERTSGDGWTRESFDVWSEERSLPAGTDAREGLRFRFTLPPSVGAEPVASGIFPNSRSSRLTVHIPGARRVVAQNHPPVDRFWTLTLSAPTPGPDFHARIEVPMAPPPRKGRLP